MGPCVLCICPSVYPGHSQSIVFSWRWDLGQIRSWVLQSCSHWTQIVYTMKHIAIQNGRARSILARSMEPWNLPWKACTRSEGRHYRSNSSRISGISLKFGGIPDRKVHGANTGPIWGRQDPWTLLSGMMHTTIKQIAITNGHARPIFVRFTENLL